MKTKIIITALIMGISISMNSWSTMTNNTAPSSVSGDWYYSIGGGQTISSAPHTSENAYGLNGSAAWNMNASCGNFDFNTSITGFMNDIKAQADTAVNSMVTAATGFISSLPALILQRANPGLYDLLQNGILRGEEQFDIAIKTCEEMEKDFSGGENPFDDFISVSRKADWNSAKTSGGNVISTKKTINSNVGNSGVVWTGGNQKGGTGQNAIEIIKDVSFSGYNMVMDRNPTTTTAPGTAGGRMAEVFQTPAAMSQFANDVLGDKIIRTCQGCQKVRSKAGKGLMPKLDKETNDIQTELSNLVGASGNPSYSDLDKISAHGIRITPKIIEALREEQTSEKSILLNKIASDIAMSRVLEKALILRRVLHTGKNEPNISAFSVAQEITTTSLDELNKEIENMMYESEMRKKISTGTIRMLMARKSERDNRATGVQYGVPQPSVMRDGAVQ